MAKELVTTQTVLGVLAVRMVAAAALLGLLVALARRRVHTRDLRLGVLLGLILASIFLVETFGIAGTSATNAGLIISLTIIITPLLETALGGAPLSRWFYGAGLLAVAGVALLSGGIGGTFRWGDGLILVAAVVRAVHVTTMHKRSVPENDNLHLTFVQMSTCAVVFVVGSLLWGTSVPDYVRTLDTTATLQLAYLVVLCTVFPFLVQMWAVRTTSPTRVSLLLGTEPVWAAAVGITLAGDAFGLPGAAGIVLILAGTLWGQQIEARRRSDVAPAVEVPVAVAPSGTPGTTPAVAVPAAASDDDSR
ncbi:DMT family transporter [Sanguibacter sp. YZGR15]|uniref:DMT family transporter n=1 Tax=Sanguibacter suaedae TaxID=2795737 RepID=A0A934I959_9MICO|nr:DMT family transporter [Sanguibacter suaedae]